MDKINITPTEAINSGIKSLDIKDDWITVSYGMKAREYQKKKGKFCNYGILQA